MRNSGRHSTYHAKADNVEPSNFGSTKRTAFLHVDSAEGRKGYVAYDIPSGLNYTVFSPS